MELVGYLAGILTLVGYLPQTIKTIYTRKTNDLSALTFIIIGVSAVLWTAYGLASHKAALWLTNLVVAICSLIILFIKFNSKG